MKKTAFQYIGGILGNPSIPKVDWSDEEMKLMSNMGMNFLQMNIAWGNRPNGEALTIEDIAGDKIEAFKYRAAQAKKFGMKCMPHFGMPKMQDTYQGNLSAYLTPSCTLEPKVLKHNAGMIRHLLTNVPDIEDIMIYTYDQDAWMCSEFGYCPCCSGVPLDERITPFLEFIKAEMAKYNDNCTLWWQPWELSAGQIFKVLEKISTDHFGLMLNTHGSESYFNNFENYWIHNIGVIAQERGIPIIGEIQASGSGVGAVPCECLPCPSLVYRQIELLRKLPALVGIKEHYGFVPSKISVNMLFLQEYLKDVDAPYQKIIENVAGLYGKKAAAYLLKAWDIAEKATDFIPFDFTYLYSNIAGMSPKHNFDAPLIKGIHADTPAWESNRRAFYVLTHQTEYHPWALEDAGLRFEEAGKRFYECHGLLLKALEAAEYRIEDLKEQCGDVLSMSKATTGQYLYFMESLAAYDVRIAMFQNNTPKLQAALKRFDALMLKDMANQDNDEEIVRIYELFRKDYVHFFNTHYRQQEKFYCDGTLTKFDQRY